MSLGRTLWRKLLSVDKRSAKWLSDWGSLAATILYRTLLDNTLDRARSKAYGHGAKQLEKLDLLADEADPNRPSGMLDHATYFANLKKAHPRKSAFWTRVGGEKPDTLQASRSRRPVWIRDNG